MLNQSRSRLGLFGILVLTASCVPIPRYEQTQSALNRAQADQRAAEQRNQELERRLTAAEADAHEQRERLREHESQLAASHLDTELAANARDNAVGMVEQLRGELERAGGHLRAFSDQKQELSKALAVAEARSSSAAEGGQLGSETAILMRDAALAFHSALASGTYELVFSENKPVLLVPAAGILNREELNANGQELVRNLGQFAALHPNLRLGLKFEGTAADLARGRIRVLSERLVAAGIPQQRLLMPESGPESPASGGQIPSLLRIELIPQSEASAEPRATD